MEESSLKPYRARETTLPAKSSMYCYSSGNNTSSSSDYEHDDDDDDREDSFLLQSSSIPSRSQNSKSITTTATTTSTATATNTTAATISNRTCLKCNESFETASKLNYHNKITHIHSREISDLDNVHRTIDRDPNTGLFYCIKKGCPYTSRDPYPLQRHINTHKVSWYCKRCDKNITTSYQVHQTTVHQGEAKIDIGSKVKVTRNRNGEFQCPLKNCTFKTNSPQRLTYHYKNHIENGKSKLQELDMSQFADHNLAKEFLEKQQNDDIETINNVNDKGGGGGDKDEDEEDDDDIVIDPVEYDADDDFEQEHTVVTTSYIEKKPQPTSLALSSSISNSRRTSRAAKEKAKLVVVKKSEPIELFNNADSDDVVMSSEEEVPSDDERDSDYNEGIPKSNTSAMSIDINVVDKSSASDESIKTQSGTFITPRPVNKPMTRSTTTTSPLKKPTVETVKKQVNRPVARPLLFDDDSSSDISSVNHLTDSSDNDAQLEEQGELPIEPIVNIDDDANDDSDYQESAANSKPKSIVKKTPSKLATLPKPTTLSSKSKTPTTQPSTRPTRTPRSVVKKTPFVEPMTTAKVETKKPSRTEKKQQATTFIIPTPKQQPPKEEKKNQETFAKRGIKRKYIMYADSDSESESEEDFVEPEEDGDEDFRPTRKRKSRSKAAILARMKEQEKRDRRNRSRIRPSSKSTISNQDKSEPMDVVVVAVDKNDDNNEKETLNSQCPREDDVKTQIIDKGKKNVVDNDYDKKETLPDDGGVETLNPVTTDQTKPLLQQKQKGAIETTHVYLTREDFISVDDSEEEDNEKSIDSHEKNQTLLDQEPKVSDKDDDHVDVVVVNDKTINVNESLPVVVVVQTSSIESENRQVSKEGNVSSSGNLVEGDVEMSDSPPLLGDKPKVVNNDDMLSQVVDNGGGLRSTLKVVENEHNDDDDDEYGLVEAAFTLKDFADDICNNNNNIVVGDKGCNVEQHVVGNDDVVNNTTSLVEKEDAMDIDEPEIVALQDQPTPFEVDKVGVVEPMEDVALDIIEAKGDDDDDDDDVGDDTSIKPIVETSLIPTMESTANVVSPISIKQPPPPATQDKSDDNEQDMIDTTRSDIIITETKVEQSLPLSPPPSKIHVEQKEEHGVDYKDDNDDHDDDDDQHIVLLEEAVKEKEPIPKDNYKQDYHHEVDNMVVINNEVEDDFAAVVAVAEGNVVKEFDKQQCEGNNSCNNNNDDYDDDDIGIPRKECLLNENDEEGDYNTQQQQQQEQQVESGCSQDDKVVCVIDKEEIVESVGGEEQVIDDDDDDDVVVVDDDDDNNNHEEEKEERDTDSNNDQEHDYIDKESRVDVIEQEQRHESLDSDNVGEGLVNVLDIRATTTTTTTTSICQEEEDILNEVQDEGGTFVANHDDDNNNDNAEGGIDQQDDTNQQQQHTNNNSNDNDDDNPVNNKQEEEEESMVELSDAHSDTSSLDNMMMIPSSWHDQYKYTDDDNDLTTSSSSFHQHDVSKGHTLATILLQEKANEMLESDDVDDGIDLGFLGNI